MGVLLCFAMFFPLTVQGQVAQIEVWPGDSPVKIRGRIGDDTTFVKRLGLTSTVAVPELILRSTDLISKNGQKQIGHL